MIGVNNLIETIILAGGKSSRFTRNKMKEIINGKPMIYHTIQTFIEFSKSVTIVTGFYDIDYLDLYLQDPKLHVVHNKDHEKGMFSSVKTGIKHIKSDFFLIPGDYPLVKKDTVQKLIDAEGIIRVPIFQGKKGHPIFISKELLEDLKNEPVDSNLKKFRDRYPVNYIEVDDAGVIHDVDFEDDIKKMNAERNE